MLEYFIATPGARKGLVDTALRTADSGLPDPSPRRRGPGADHQRGGPVRAGRADRSADPRHLDRRDRRPTGAGKRSYLETRLYSRTLAEDVKLGDGTKIAKGTIVVTPSSWSRCATIRPSTAMRVRLAAHLRRRDGRVGACPTACSLATNKLIELGEARGRHRRPVDRRARHAAHDADLPHRWRRRHGHRRRSAPRRRAVRGPHAPKGKARLARTTGVVRIADDEGKGQPDHGRRPTTAPRTRYPVPGLSASRWPTARRSPPVTRSPTVPVRPQGAHRDQGRPRDAAVPRRRGPEGVPRPGRVDPRQAHRADRAPDDPPRRRAGAGRQPTSCPGERVDQQGAPPTSTGSWSRRASARPRVGPR